MSEQRLTDEQIDAFIARESSVRIKWGANPTEAERVGRELKAARQEIMQLRDGVGIPEHVRLKIALEETERVETALLYFKAPIISSGESNLSVASGVEYDYRLLGLEAGDTITLSIPYRCGDCGAIVEPGIPIYCLRDTSYLCKSCYEVA